MLVDTHCHINMMIKQDFDRLLLPQEIQLASTIIEQARQQNVTTIINVGTSYIESHNCIILAQTFASCYAAVGIHPNDCLPTWKEDFHRIKQQWFIHQHHADLKIVAIGEIGLDTHYPGYDLQRQIDAFKTQMELALQFQLPVIVHTRKAPEETLKVLHEYKKDGIYGTIHCFSEDYSFAQETIALGFVLGIGGPLTYPKNNYLRNIFSNIALENMVLETDAPFLPPQSMRGKQNSPANIALIAQYLATLRHESVDTVAATTTATAKQLFKIT